MSNMFKKQCPNCQKMNDDSLIKCQCGYQFEDYKEPNEDKLPSNINVEHVVIDDIRMDFTSMVVFMVKWALASIPALVILFFIGVFLIGLFGARFFSF